MAAIITVGAVLAFGMPAFDAISQYSNGQSGPGLMAATGASLALLVVGWLAMTEVIFPLIFRSRVVRQIILGKYYIEGTWLQAERGVDEKRMSVIDIQPDGDRFIFSGYSLNEDLEIQSNIMIEFSRFEWPFMVYKYRNSLSDGGDGRRDGVGEIQLEMNRSSARRYNGFLQYVKSDERLKIEGAKLTRESEVNQLRRLDGRQQIFEKYWKLFFHRAMRPSTGLNYPANMARRHPVEDQPVQSQPAMSATRSYVDEFTDTGRDQAQTPIHASFKPVAQSVQAKLQAMHPAGVNRPTESDGTPVERRSGPGGAQAGPNRVVRRRRSSDWTSRSDRTEAVRIPNRPIIRTRHSEQGLNGTDD